MFSPFNERVYKKSCERWNGVIEPAHYPYVRFTLRESIEIYDTRFPRDTQRHVIITVYLLDVERLKNPAWETKGKRAMKTAKGLKAVGL